VAEDLPLCERGRQAAQKDCSAIGTMAARLVVCGPDDACRATAMIVAQRLGNAPVKSVEKLAEPSLGLWEGQHVEQLEARYGSVYRAWREDPGQIVPPEGEPLVEAQQRILKALSGAIGRGFSEPIAVILRPIALGLVRAQLRQESLQGVWGLIEGSPCVEWVSVQAADLRYRTPVLGTR
jgi:broad specificity phosphatase PhoE